MKKNLKLTTLLFFASGVLLQAQPTLVKDLNTGNSPGISSFVSNQNGIFFKGYSSEAGIELWYSNPATGTTSMVNDLAVGTSYASIEQMIDGGNNLYFSYNNTIYATNGTTTKEVSFWDNSIDNTWKPENLMYSTSGHAYFSNPDDFNASLFRTNASGQQQLIIDFYQEIKNITDANGTVYFAGNRTFDENFDNDNYGLELRKSNGTREGTVLVKDINPNGSSNPANMKFVNGILYFTANDGIHGNELWRSDGTASGTYLLKDVFVGTSNSDISELTELNGKVFFIALDSPGNKELWMTDGTLSGTEKLKEINTKGSSNPGELTVLGNNIIFKAGNGVDGLELWKTDGTIAGTLMVKNINPTGSSNPRYLKKAGNNVFFNALSSKGKELWSTDGTSDGTKLVKDIYPGANYSDPKDLVEHNGIVYFSAYLPTIKRELWKSDGTALGTVLVSDTYNPNPNQTHSNPTSIIKVNDKIYFTATNGIDNQLWRTEGTSAGTLQVNAANPLQLANKTDLMKAGNKVLFFVGSNLYSIDNTQSTPLLLVSNIFPPINYQLRSEYKTELNGIAYFSAKKDKGYELYRSDGTIAGTYIVKNLFDGGFNNPGGDSNPYFLTKFKNELYFSAIDQEVNVKELFKSDGTEAGTVIVKRLLNSQNYMDNEGPRFLKNINDSILLFTSELGLTRTDGTEAGTYVISPIGEYGPEGEAQNFESAANTIFFNAYYYGFGKELWKTDGTEAGTIRVKDIFPGEGDSNPEYLFGINNNSKVWFVATDPIHGREIWVSDGTTDGTVMLKDINPGSASSGISQVIKYNDILYFVANDGFNGSELWKSDGTEAGTVQVYDINPTGNSNIKSLTLIGNTLYFSADNGSIGTSLWKYTIPGSSNRETNDGNAIASSENIFSIYPNPASQGDIQLGKFVDNYSIINSEGKKILQGSNVNKINIDILKSGIYFVEIDNKVQKLIKQ